MSAPDDDHYHLVATRIKEAHVVPFLGAGANLCDRPEKKRWKKGSYLPDGRELAQVLVKKSGYPDTKDSNLLRVSQYLDAKLGAGTLYEYLRDVFDAGYPSNSLHRFFASLPPLLRKEAHARKRPVRHQLIITTNYDDALERAFDEVHEPYDLVWYEAKPGQTWGRFLHLPPGGAPIPVERANKYPALSREERTVILKLHGAVHQNPAWDSYVITEDSYIDYLSQGDISSRIPIKLLDHMRESHFLFLGYSLSDWNLRVILNRIWGSQQLDRTSWAIQLEPHNPSAKVIEETLWRDRLHIAPLYAPLREYLAALSVHVFDGGPPRGGGG